MSDGEWDAIVVGAGPAGSALACRLCPQRRVLLLDRAPLRDAATAPRIGESLPGAARVVLQRCGAWQRFAAAGHAERGATVSQWDSDEPVWFDHLRDPNGPGWHLDRNRFDRDLRDTAVAAGAVLLDDAGTLRIARDGDRWTVAGGARGDVHRAPLLIDATGRSAAIARQLGIARRVEDELICLHAYLPADPDDDDRCTRIGADDNGWWYSVRVPDGRRVLAFHLDAGDAELRTLRVASNLLAKARRLAVLADVLPDASDAAVHARPAGSAVLDGGAGAHGATGFLAIGDAGLSFDPVASQGLFHALASAESAANAIARDDAIAAHAAFAGEMRAVHAHYRNRLRDTYAGPVRFAHRAFWSRRASY